MSWDICLLIVSCAVFTILLFLFTVWGARLMTDKTSHINCLIEVRAMLETCVVLFHEKAPDGCRSGVIVLRMVIRTLDKIIERMTSEE